MRRLLLGLLAILVAIATFTFSRSIDQADATEAEHCLATVIGTLDSGEMQLSEPICVVGDEQAQQSLVAAVFGSGETASAASGLLARHYDGDGYSGASLTISGGTCNGGWYYLPSNWTNRINSTLYLGPAGGCNRIRHYDWAAGRFKSTWPNGNLYSMANRADAIYYDY